MSKSNADWEQIEKDYRAGLLSVREIAAANGVSHVAIGKRAKKEGWERDLKAKIKAKADALVTKRTVTSEVTKQDKIDERILIEANAEVIANIRMQHRTDISRSRNLAMKMLEELELQTGNLEMYEQLGELMRSPSDKGIDRLNDIYNKVISLAGRSSTIKTLSDTLKNLITLERQAYGMDDVTGTGDDDGQKDIDMNDLTRRLAFVLTKQVNGGIE